MRKSTLFSLFFLRAVRVKNFFVGFFRRPATRGATKPGMVILVKPGMVIPICVQQFVGNSQCRLRSFLFLSFCHSCESRNPGLVFLACEKEKETTLDPRLLMSRMTEGEKQILHFVQDDHSGASLRIVHVHSFVDNSQCRLRSFLLLSFCHSCESRNPGLLVVRRKRQR